MVQPFIRAIDKAAAMCGSRNALARELGITSGNMSEACAGKRKFSDEHLEQIAALLQMEAADLVGLQASYYYSKKSTLRKAAETLLTVFLCVVLSLTGNDGNLATARANVISQQPNTIHIVGFCVRKLTLILWRIASSIRQAWSMPQAC